MELLNTHPIKKSDLGFHGNLFGGKILAWVDAAASGLAMQLCDSPRLVTKKFEEVVFEKPVKIKNLIKIYGEVVRFGNTSITIKLEARKHNIETGTQQIVCTTKVVFVKINDEGESIPISDRVKIRYADRKAKYGRGLLSPEELEKELKSKIS